MSKDAKFFCESCGAEVPRNARVCRHCGRFFSSVRCPNCGATGSPDKFADGCPECGYTVAGNGNAKSSRFKEKKATRAAKKGLQSAIDTKASALGFSSPRGDDALPFWIYVLTGLILLGILFFFLHYFGR